jgi:hypothetical protein
LALADLDPGGPPELTDPELVCLGVAQAAFTLVK